MFKTLLKKELAENIQNHRFTIALIVCTVLIPLSFFFNQKQYTSRKTSYEESVRAYENSRKTLMALRRKGAALYRPPSPLTLLSTGVEYLLPEGVETVGFINNRGIRTREINTGSFNNPLASLYGHLDLNFVVCVVLSVLAILFAFNTISGEKEKRSLSQIIAHAVPRPLILLAKSSASILLLTTAFLTGFLAGIFVLEVTGYHLLADFNLFFPFLLAFGAGILFIIVMINLGLFISTLCKNSVVSMLVLIIGWAFFYMLLPKGSVILAKFIKPVASQQVIDQEKNQLRISLRTRLDRDVEERQTSDPGLRHLGNRDFFRNLNRGSEVEKRYVEDTDALQAQFQSDLTEGLRGIDQKYNNQLAVQAAIARNIARLSPISCFTHFLVEESRTGTMANVQWQEAHQRLRRMLEEQIASKHKTTRFKHMSTSRYAGFKDGPAPRVTYQEVHIRSVFGQTWPDLILLVLYAGLFFTGAFAAFMRYDVR